MLVICFRIDRKILTTTKDRIPRLGGQFSLFWINLEITENFQEPENIVFVALGASWLKSNLSV